MDGQLHSPVDVYTYTCVCACTGADRSVDVFLPSINALLAHSHIHHTTPHDTNSKSSSATPRGGTATTRRVEAGLRGQRGGSGGGWRSGPRSSGPRCGELMCVVVGVCRVEGWLGVWPPTDPTDPVHFPFLAPSLTHPHQNTQVISATLATRSQYFKGCFETTMVDARLVSLAEPMKRALVIGADDEEGACVGRVGLGCGGRVGWVMGGLGGMGALEWCAVCVCGVGCGGATCRCFQPIHKPTQSSPNKQTRR